MKKLIPDMSSQIHSPCDIFGSPLAVRNEEKKGGDKITCIADDAGPSHRCSMRQRGTGASGGQIAISIDDFASHA